MVTTAAITGLSIANVTGIIRSRLTAMLTLAFTGDFSYNVSLRARALAAAHLGIPPQ